MDFPPQSQELNPIEKLWDHLKWEKLKHDPTVKTTCGMSLINAGIT
jgi:transposase